MSTADVHQSNAVLLQDVKATLPDPSAALFQRKSSKPKAGKSRRSAKAAEIVGAARDSELEINKGLGGRPQDDVLDLADQLMRQLDAGAEPDRSIDNVAVPDSSADALSSSASASLRSEESGSSLRSLDSAASDSTHRRRSSLSRKLHKMGEGLAHTLSPQNLSPHLGPTQPLTGRRVSRGQARKDKRTAEEEALREQARRETAGPDAGEVERQAFDRICADNDLTMVEMPPDGHCLFSAVADQLNLMHPKRDKKFDYHETRHAAADYMRQHPDDFMPFMTAEDVGGSSDEIMSSDQFAKYCDSIEQTGEWGGQTEILALSHSFTLPIDVFEARGPVVKNGENYVGKGPAARISYHQSSYGLGQHYNSLHPRSSKNHAVDAFLASTIGFG